MASSILKSNTTAVLATAMAVSGTVIVLALRLQKFSVNHLPRSCISSDEKTREKKKKKVQFAEDVVEPVGNGEEFRKRLANKRNRNREMAANRMALYSGILRDRAVNRTAYSY
ncbi:uncharacterized protein LOC141711158 [Apium graveolens]|uniref:uncharacterized protein LOC141711158 n=1 Tax=Apium graveolens TaxID=4045 RepID=UPI003D7B6BCA